MSLSEIGARYEATVNEIDRISKIMKTLRATKKEILEVLRNYMSENDLKELRCGNYMLKFTKPKPKKIKLSKEEIEETLAQMMRKETCSKVLKELFDNDNQEQEEQEKITLKKIKN